MPLKNVFETALTDTWTADQQNGVTQRAIADQPGDIRWEGNKCYKCVIYDQLDSLDLAIGDCVYYVDDSGYPAHTVTADASAATGKQVGAGVAQAVVTADNQRLWIQIKGHATVTVIGGTPSDGDPLTMEAAADKGLTLLVDTDAADALHQCALTCDYSELEIVCDFPF